jgi:ubiquinone/menaquinone biosynthesis C-methylase UbiE
MQAKAYKGMGMEGSIARWYAKNTRRDKPEFKALARRMSEHLARASKVLEVAPGPGFFCIELAKLGRYQIAAIDISDTFVKIARKNAQDEGVEVDFRRGNASSMPFSEGAFDLIVCRAAFKNFAAPVAALREMHRVLAPRGRAVIIDLRKDAPRSALEAYVDGLGVGAVNAFVMKWTFRLMLLKRAYTREQFQQFISQSGFAKSAIEETPVGFEITLTK